MKRRTTLILVVVYLLSVGGLMVVNLYKGRWVAAFEPLAFTIVGAVLHTLYDVYVPPRVRRRLRIPGPRRRLPQPPAAPPAPAPLIRSAVPGSEDG